MRGSTRKPRPAPRRAGLSLIQVVVASGVLVVALLPLFTLLSSSVRTTEVSLDELRAAYLADELVTQLRLLALEPGFDRIPEVPVGVDPGNDVWLDLSDSNSGAYQKGALLPHPLEGTGAVEVETDGWRNLGAPFCRDTGPSPDPLIESLSRIWLSPAPAGWKRLVRIYDAPLTPSGLAQPNVKRIEVRLTWSRTFLGTPTQERSLQVSTLLANPGRLQ